MKLVLFAFRGSRLNINIFNTIQRKREEGQRHKQGQKKKDMPVLLTKTVRMKAENSEVSTDKGKQTLFCGHIP